MQALFFLQLGFLGDLQVVSPKINIYVFVWTQINSWRVEMAPVFLFSDHCKPVAKPWRNQACGRLGSFLVENSVFPTLQRTDQGQIELPSVVCITSCWCWFNVTITYRTRCVHEVRESPESTWLLRVFFTGVTGVTGVTGDCWRKEWQEGSFKLHFGLIWKKLKTELNYELIYKQK